MSARARAAAGQTAHNHGCSLGRIAAHDQSTWPLTVNESNTSVEFRTGEPCGAATAALLVSLHCRTIANRNISIPLWHSQRALARLVSPKHCEQQLLSGNTRRSISHLTLSHLALPHLALSHLAVLRTSALLRSISTSCACRASRSCRSTSALFASCQAKPSQAPMSADERRSRVRANTAAA